MRMKKIASSGSETRISAKYSVLVLCLFFPLALLSFGLGYFVAGKFLDPINHLRTEIDETKAKNLSKRLPKHSDDEIGDFGG